MATFVRLSPTFCINMDNYTTVLDEGDRVVLGDKDDRYTEFTDPEECRRLRGWLAQKAWRIA